MRRLATALMVVAAATLFIASAIHSGAIGSFDLFPGAAIPEAVIGAVVAIGALASLASPSAWSIAIVATAFAIAGTLFGMGFTVPRGVFGDIVYHAGLLVVLAVAAALLLRDRPRRA